MSSIEAVLTELGFPEAQHVQGRAVIADLFKKENRCGIYFLHCAGNEYYAGKAVDVTRRYIQHCQNHPDIEKISFKEVEKNRLDEEERRVINTLEKAEFFLRNILLTSFPVGASDFDTVISVEDQNRWLDDLSYQDFTGSRVINPDFRRKYSPYYQKLVQMPYASEIFRVMNKYVRVGVPAPLKTELSFWCCSCLPKVNREIKIYSRININVQEVFTVGTVDSKPFFSWHLANSPLTVSLNQLITKYNLVVDDHRYEAGGQDQIHIEIEDSVDKALALLNEPPVIAAIRRFNLGMMRKGPSLNSMSHCLDLADKLLEAEK
jgi:hypothetical protein